MAMGQFTDGKYFGMSSEILCIFDDDYHKAWENDLVTEEWEQEHFIDSYDYDMEEFEIVREQIKESL